MSDRFISLTVILENPMRADDLQPTIDAIRQLRGVMDVTPIVIDPQTYWAQERARRDLVTKLYEVLQPEVI